MKGTLFERQPAPYNSTAPHSDMIHTGLLLLTTAKIMSAMLNTERRIDDVLDMLKQDLLGVYEDLRWLTTAATYLRAMLRGRAASALHAPPTITLLFWLLRLPPAVA